MSAVIQTEPQELGLRPFLNEWWPILMGLLALYVPTYITLANGIWDTEENAHGPIILAVVLWIIWHKRHEFLSPAHEIKKAPVSGATIFVFGLLLYVLGRSQDILVFEIGSQIPVLGGAILFFRGWRVLRSFWFPLFFILFMIPLPGFIVDGLTGPLKQYVSLIVEQALYGIGYPIARNGVVLTIGNYQLLVADACSGLNSMFSLSALGLFYMYLLKHTSWLRNAILLASILPIAFLANTARVMILVLITYYLGDEAGQGFLHGFAGIVLFVVELLALFGLDALLGKALPDIAKSKASAS